MNEKQQTLKQPVSLSGIGLHTGKPVTVTLKPAAPNHGIRFQRVDLPERPTINADADLVVDTSRGTTLEQNGGRVSTVEHLLAALVGMQVDNILVEIDSMEAPILDGSAMPYIKAIYEAGIEQQDSPRNYFVLDTILEYKDPAKQVELVAVPDNGYRLTVMIDYNSKVLGTQHAHLDKIEDFEEYASGARTFCFLHEIEYLVKQNLIKGGDLSNAIVVVDREVSEEELDKLSEILNKPKIRVEKTGILSNIELRHENEPARHKLLDLLGDLALVGRPIKGRIVATRPGHAANVQLAKVIKAYIKENRNKENIPKYDPLAPPVYDINQIEKMLPHNYPFLLVDKIIEMSDKHVVGLKNVTFNEPFFQGHFPGNPVMPAVLQLEAMAQAGGILALSTVPDPENYDTYFLKIDQARFKNKVGPGDTLLLKLELLSPIRRGICEMKAVAYVGDKIASEALLMAKIMRREQA